MKSRELDQLMTRTILIGNLRNRVKGLIQNTWNSISKKEKKKILNGFVTQYIILRNKMNEMHLDKRDISNYDLRFKNLPWGNYGIPNIGR